MTFFLNVGIFVSKLFRPIPDCIVAPYEADSQLAFLNRNGMADFIEKEVVTVADYDLYCHYVAGLVGVGLSEVSK